MTQEAQVVRVYMNGRGVDVTEGATALDALRTADADVAALVESGKRGFVDSRGLPVPPDSMVFAGAIFRVVSARGPGGAA